MKYSGEQIRGELVTSIILPDLPDPDSPKNGSSVRKVQKLIEPIRIKPKLQPSQIKQNYNHQGYLLGDLDRSEKLLNFNIRQSIEQRRGMIETKVHDIAANQPKSIILQNLYSNSGCYNPHLQNEITAIVESAQQKITKSPQLQKKIIPKSKADLKELQKVDKYRLLKIKNGEIKNKIGNLRDQLQLQYYVKKANYKLPDHQNVKVSDYYSLDNPRTIEANNFIQRLQEKRHGERSKWESYVEKQRRMQQVKSDNRREQKEMEALKRRQRLEEYYEERLARRKLEEAENDRKKAEFKDWSKIYKQEKPLYIRKEEQFIGNHLIPELQEKQEKLIQLKEQRRPIDFEEINYHDERYMEFKNDDEIRKQAYLEMQRDRERDLKEEVDQYYKGKYRYLVLQDEINNKMRLGEDPKEEQRAKKARQVIYGDYIKNKEKKKKQLKQLKKSQANLNDKKHLVKRFKKLNGSLSMDNGDADMSEEKSSSNPRAEGKKNLHFLKQMVKNKGVIKDRPHIKLIEQRNVYPDYMAEARQKRKQSLNLSSIRYEEEGDQSFSCRNVDSMKAVTDNLQNRVRRAEMRKKHSKLSHQQNAEIEEAELKALKMKVSLLNSIN